jgi:hypothetical protein
LHSPSFQSCRNIAAQYIPRSPDALDESLGNVTIQYWTPLTMTDRIGSLGLWAGLFSITSSAMSSLKTADRLMMPLQTFSTG